MVAHHDFRMRARVWLALAIAWLSAITPLMAIAQNSPTGIHYGNGDEILLQGFHWESVRLSGAWYETLKMKAPAIAADGFTAVWMPPSWRDASSWKDATTGASGGGEGYFWRDFVKDGRYGSDAQLRGAVNALTAVHIKLIYDVVPNHMDRSYASKFADLPTSANVWRQDCSDKGAGTGASGCDDGDPFMSGDADLNIGNPDVAAMFAKEYANLRDHYGASGLRFDYVRGYAPEHVRDWMKGVMDTGFCVGELWKAPNEFPQGDPLRNKSWQDILKQWSDRSGCTVFDFALKERMQNGSVADWRNGLNGNPDAHWREVAVTFVDNHDTGFSPGPSNGQHHWPLPEPLLKQAYAYILTSPGTPTVYWPHMYDGTLHDYLHLLIQLRRTAGVRADSEIQFSTNYSGLVATVKGAQQILVLALNSNLAGPNQITQTTMIPVLSSDQGAVRVWRSGPASTPVPVLFRCNKGVTQPGDSVYVVGSSAELGNWDPSKAVRLADVSAYPVWKGTLTMAGQQEVEWKCIIRTESDASQVKSWQPGSNNALIVTSGASTSGSF